jgi:hypothetical protein
MLCGAAIAVQSVFRQASVVALWSDFKAFEAKVAELDNGKAVLSLGGESSSDNLESLVDKLWKLERSSAHTIELGLLVFILSALGLALDFRRTKRSNKALQATAAAPPVL